MNVTSVLEIYNIHIFFPNRSSIFFYPSKKKNVGNLQIFYNYKENG